MQTSSLTPSRGVVIGRFMPPHRGHLYLVNFARSYCDELTVLVCTLPNEPIPGDLRYSWMKELFPDVSMVHITEAIPEARKDVPGSTGIWARTIRSYVPDHIDFVFASEPYGAELASHLDASFVAVDPARTQFPVSATDIRRSPMEFWDFIPEPVRPYFLKKVLVVSDGDELARLIAERLDTLYVADYSVFWARYHGTTPAVSDLPSILRAQRASEDSLARQSRRVLVSAISALHLGMAAREAHGGLTPDVEAAVDRYVRGDRYDLCILDRDFAGERVTQYESWFREQSIPVHTLDGTRNSWLEESLDAVRNLLFPDS